MSVGSRIGRRLVALTGVASMMLAAVWVFVPEVARAATPEENAVASGLTQLLDTVKGLDGLDELADPLPFSDVLPTGPSGLGISNILDHIKNEIDGLPDKTAGAVETALNGLDGDEIAPGGPVLHIDADVTGTGITFDELSATYSVQKPLRFLSGAPNDPATFTLDGGQLDADLALVLAEAAGEPLVLSLDTSGTPTAFLAKDSSNPPTAHVTADLSLQASAMAVRLGILDVSADGTVSVGVDLAVNWLDPDSDGRISLTELTGSAATDLFDVGFASSHANMDLDLTSDLAGLGGVTGTIDLNDTDLSNGVSTPTVNLGGLGDFTNMTPQDVLAAIAQLVVNLRTLQSNLGGNLNIPLIDQNLAQLGSWSDKISKLFTDNKLSLADNPIDLQIAPEVGAQCGNGVDDDADGTADEGCPGQPSDLESKGLATIEGIIGKLAQTLTGSTGDLGLAYDPTTHSVTWTIDSPNQNFFQQPPTAVLDVADELAKAGITGLDVGGGATVSITPTYSLELKVGLDLSDALSDPAQHPITERIFIAPQVGPEASINVPIKANLDMLGKIGLLKVALTDNAPAGAPDNGLVSILGPRAGDTTPMLSVDLTGGGSDGRLTLKEIFDGLTSVTMTPAGNTLTLDLGGGTTIVGALNASVGPIGLKADATVGTTPLASGLVTFTWPDVTVGTPTVTTDGAFDDNLLSFNIDPNDPQALFSTILQALDAALSAVEDLAGSEAESPLPVIGTSLKDLMAFVDPVQDALNALANDPAQTLELLELSAEGAISQALDSLQEKRPEDDAAGQCGTDATDNDGDGVVNDGCPANGPAETGDECTDEVDGADADGDVNDGCPALNLPPLPPIPNPADPQFNPGGEFDLDAFRVAVATYVDKLVAYVQLAGDFITLDYVPGNSPGDFVYKLEIGICSDKTTHPGCKFEFPLTKQFNLDLSDVVGSEIGGIIGAQGAGDVDLDYDLTLNAHIGVELPDVTEDDGDADSLPQISGAPRVFLLDSSGIHASVEGSATAEFSATIGPFTVQAGETAALPEEGAECGTDTTDDDGDGFVNDGCPAVNDTSEVDVDGACDAGNTADDDSDAGLEVNDGCPAQGNPLVAKAGAEFTLNNDIGDAGLGNAKFYLDATAPEQGFVDFVTGLTPSLNKLVDCPTDATPGVNDFACAHIPIYLASEVTPGELTFLGNLDLTVPNFDLSGTTLTGTDTILANLQAAAEAFVFDLIAQGIQQFGEVVADTVSAASYDVEIPVVGDLLDAGAEVATTFKENVTDPAADLVASLDSAGDFATIRTAIQDFFWNNLDGAATTEDGRLLLNFDDLPAQPVKAEDIIVVIECKSGANPVEDCETGANGPYTLLDLYNIQVQVAIGQQAQATTPAFDWGVPGLRLSGTNTLTGLVSWQVNLGFGISLEDGFYLLSKTQASAAAGGDDIAVRADVDFGTVDVVDDAAPFLPTGPPALEGDLAFIGAALWNAKEERLDADHDDDEDGHDGHEVHLQLGVDIPDPSASDDRIGLGEILTAFNPSELTVHLEGKVDFLATLATTASVGGGPSEGTIPRLLADLNLSWGFDADLNDGISTDDLDAGFDNVRLDLGSFIAEFLSPILSEVQKYTKPLQPIIDTVNAPIPGVSQLAELVGLDPVTLMDLFELVSDNDLTMIRRLLDVITFVNSIPTVAAGTPALVIPLGSFGLDTGMLTKAEVPSNVKDKLIAAGSQALDAGVNGANGVLGAIGSKASSGAFGPKSGTFGTQLAKSTSTDGGFTFPAFKDPSQLFQLLVGKDVSLVEFDAGRLRAEAGWSQTFGPITIGPVPVSIVVSLSASIEGRFVIGYDTKGIRQLVKNLTDDDGANDSFFGSVGVLLAGVYLGDLAADGSDPPEIRLVLEGAVGAALDLVIVKVGIEAGLRATLDLNLHDGGFLDPVPPENLDGKLRIDEIITFINNPLCLFDVSGKLEAFIRVFVTLDFFLFSVTFKQTIVNIVLLEMDNITAELCKPPPPVLAQDVGGGVLRLNMGSAANRSARNYAVDEEAEKFVVRQITPGTSDVKVTVTAFGLTQEFAHVNKVVADGDTKDDSVTAEPGSINGICQNDGTSVVWSVPEGDPTPNVNCLGGPGNDDNASPGETVTVQVDFQIPLHACGGPGKDRLGGGSAVDRLAGEGKLSGSGSSTDCDPSVGSGNVDDADKIAGQGGGDSLFGNDGDDVITGDNGNDTISGGPGLDDIAGGIGRDTINGDTGEDHIVGGPEGDPCPTGPDADRDTCSLDADDTINGGDQDDVIEGDNGKDTLNGDGGNDTIVGGLGDDTANGGTGADSIFGNQGFDSLSGAGGDDDIVGGVGNDAINGDGEYDDLIGEEGDDTINGGDGLDIVLGDLGVINRAPGSPGFTALPDKLLFELKPSPPGIDHINGDGDADLLYGQEGDDVMTGGGGNDEMHGNAGADRMSGNAADDAMFGDAGNDAMFGDAEDPADAGAADGADTMRGGPDNDTMSGNAKGDSMFGDGGSDVMFGDADVEDCANDGNDTMSGGPDGDYMFGNSGDDTINGDGATDRIVGGSNTSGVCDGNDTGSGGEQDDVIAGDNATIGAADTADGMFVTLFLDDQGIGDTLHGNNHDDRVYGQTGVDTIFGDNGNDVAEGNADGDTVNGGAGDDDLVGGSSANDGIVGATRIGDGAADAVDTIHGDAGSDWIAGDNALIHRNFQLGEREPVELFDVELVGGSDPAAGSSAGDFLHGDADVDEIFGQGGPDTISGGDAGDYIEGNHDDDSISGDAGNDDLVGGGSANDGKIDADRLGNTLRDVGETLISGGPGEDYIAGDNALISRVVPSDAPAPIRLFDVETTTTGPLPGTGGGELLITGGDGPDWIFGQTGNDNVQGDAGTDYVEGNNGNDSISGGTENDDLVGGGSADNGIIDDNRVGNDLLDLGETVMHGDEHDDWMTGDNALVNRNRQAAGRAPIELFDVQNVGILPAVESAVSGGDIMHGDADNDRMFGQGNGAQPDGQTDPADGRNNDFVGTSAAAADFDKATGTVDENAAAWQGDTIFGGVGDDYIEGNHGNDVIWGNGSAATGQDEDDIAGGGSANDGRIFDTSCPAAGCRLGLGVTLLDGFDTIHGDFGDNTAGDDDAIIGDNGWVKRLTTRQVGTGPDNQPVDQFDRDVQMTQVKAEPGTFANDFISGNGGHDELYGQQGDDYAEGGYGSDAIIGDLGKVQTDLLGFQSDALGLANCGAARTISPNEPFISHPVCQPGELFRLVTLFVFNDTITSGANAVAAGNDVLLGLDGDDWMHGGPGVDLMNGDGDGGAEITDPAHTYTTDVTDPNPASHDSDHLFGGDSNGAGTVSAVTGGNGDAIWGGRGEDHGYGGRGDDMIDVRPDPANPTNFPREWSAWAEADVESYHGIDFHYGGYDQDAMQANVADNGPIAGDRLFDWVGAYNIYYLCPATYGAYVNIRDQSPAILAYFEDQARTDGALTPATSGTSGFRELALVYKPDVKNNANPIYPGTPGHFFCVDLP